MSDYIIRGEGEDTVIEIIPEQPIKTKTLIHKQIDENLTLTYDEYGNLVGATIIDNFDYGSYET